MLYEKLAGVTLSVRFIRSWALPMVIAAGVSALGCSLRRPVAERSDSRSVTATFPPRGEFFELSRNGRRLVVGLRDSLLVRDLDDDAMRMVPLPLQGAVPVPSADGFLVAFTRAAGNGTFTLHVAPTTGGAPTLIADSVNALGQKWGVDGNVYFVRNSTLTRARAAGGAVEPLVKLKLVPARARAARVDDVIPGRNAAIVTGFWSDSAATAQAGPPPVAHMRVVPFDGREPQSLGLRGNAGRVLPGGYLLFRQVSPEARMRQMAVRFDLGALQAVGDPIMLFDTDQPVTWSDDGTAVYSAESLGWRGALGPRNGAVRLVTGLDRAAWWDAIISPNGRWVAWGRTMPGEVTDNLWVQEGLGGPVRPLTHASARDSAVITPAGWSSDGSRVYYAAWDVPRSRAVGRDVWVLMAASVENAFAPETVFAHATLSGDVVVAPDGRTILWVPDSLPSTVWRGSIGSSNGAELLRVPGGTLSRPRLSPDGRWLAYVSTESGVRDVYVHPVGPAGQRSRIATEAPPPGPGADTPFWSKSGRSIFVSRYGRPSSLWEAKFDPASGTASAPSAVMRAAYRIGFGEALPGDSVFLGETPELLPEESHRVVIRRGMLGEIQRRLQGVK